MASADIINHSLYPNSKMILNVINFLKNMQDQHKLLKILEIKKIKDFVRIYQIAVDHIYKIGDSVLIRHFLLETVEEINNDLIQYNKSYKINFRDDMFNYSVDENEVYLKRKEFYDDDGTFNDFKFEERLETLNKIVRSCTLGYKLFLNPKEIKTDLPVLYL